MNIPFLFFTGYWLNLLVVIFADTSFWRWFGAILMVICVLWLRYGPEE
jgi:general stress protein CsbA